MERDEGSYRPGQGGEAYHLKRSLDGTGGAAPSPSASSRGVLVFLLACATFALALVMALLWLL